MNTTRVFKYSEDDNYQEKLAFLYAWAKRKEERQLQFEEDCRAGKYDQRIKELNELNKKSNV